MLILHDLTIFNKIAIHATGKMAADKDTVR